MDDMKLLNREMKKQQLRRQIVPNPADVHIKNVPPPEEERKGGVFSFLFRHKIVSLFFVLLNTVLTLYPTSLIQRGREMMDAGMAEIERLQIIDMASAAYQQYFEGSRLTTRGQRLSGILTFPPVLLAIPVNYFLFFREEKSVGEMLAEGAGLVVRFFWRILGLGLRCCSVLIVGCFCVVFIRGRVLPYLVLLVFLVFWLPWSMLASAKLAAEMIGVGPEDPWWART